MGKQIVILDLSATGRSGEKFDQIISTLKKAGICDIVLLVNQTPKEDLEKIYCLEKGEIVKNEKYVSVKDLEDKLKDQGFKLNIVFSSDVFYNNFEAGQTHRECYTPLYKEFTDNVEEELKKMKGSEFYIIDDREKYFMKIINPNCEAYSKYNHIESLVKMKLIRGELTSNQGTDYFRDFDKIISAFEEAELELKTSKLYFENEEIDFASEELSFCDVEFNIKLAEFEKPHNTEIIEEPYSDIDEEGCEIAKFSFEEAKSSFEKAKSSFELSEKKFGEAKLALTNKINEYNLRKMFAKSKEKYVKYEQIFLISDVNQFNNIKNIENYFSLEKNNDHNYISIENININYKLVDSIKNIADQYCKERLKFSKFSWLFFVPNKERESQIHEIRKIANALGNSIGGTAVINALCKLDEIRISIWSENNLFKSKLNELLGNFFDENKECIFQYGCTDLANEFASSNEKQHILIGREEDGKEAKVFSLD